ncbi:uncharacterized protein YecE (DUF72 family) [Enterococcus sp. PF1-24]|uniref:DUF72 domain-containing protein n=1 Tax=unclassified Enterococcus TaxID=2608891 RepID=UPI0024744FAF|nr:MULTISPECIES: DUF72 domain-containing protein [unclassified Enterococcus]MDH6365718.1 uncharacterized protein YecE (DUF72 family) [Enterococcus sp. PFB1-1]MDH6402824.1 uncharacterized protein YecE (DUF72 family) [Enterococcus sp. PF1-24]
MLRIGLTRFDEHQGLTGKNRSSLYEYASHLPIVELDTAYYAIPKQTTVANWLTQIPADFRFVIKAYAGLTTQEANSPYFNSVEEMAAAFLEAFEPLQKAGKLFCFLFQFPAYFTCTPENVAYLRKLRLLMGDSPIAIEFRDNSWYSEKVVASMRNFMEQEKFSLAIIDEPQVANRSVPLADFITNSEFTLVRLHGRNLQGWQEKGPDWQKKRTLYDYSLSELQELQKLIEKIQPETKEVAIIFNNNSGGHAAGNALSLIKLLHLEYKHLNPKQMTLF